MLSRAELAYIGSRLRKGWPVDEMEKDEYLGALWRQTEMLCKRVTDLERRAKQAQVKRSAADGGRDAPSSQVVLDDAA
jgi:hypothetical protein